MEQTAKFSFVPHVKPSRYHQGGLQNPSLSLSERRVQRRACAPCRRQNLRSCEKRLSKFAMLMDAVIGAMLHFSSVATNISFVKKHHKIRKIERSKCQLTLGVAPRATHCGAGGRRRSRIAEWSELRRGLRGKVRHTIILRAMESPRSWKF